MTGDDSSLLPCLAPGHRQKLEFSPQDTAVALRSRAGGGSTRLSVMWPRECWDPPVPGP